MEKTKLTNKEIDKLVASKVMRWSQEDVELHCGGFHAWCPTTRIELAWQVVEKVRGFSRLYDFELYVYGDNEATAEFVTDKTYRAFGESPEHAICLAALKTMGVDVE